MPSEDLYLHHPQLEARTTERHRDLNQICNGEYSKKKGLKMDNLPDITRAGIMGLVGIRNYLAVVPISN
jgi:hypothetical protein